MPLTSGHKLAAYEIVSALGAGGMGEVYRARDTRLGREVALKILPPDVTNEPGRLERFDREARAIAALNHPHIVTIYSTEEADGIRFLTMELVDGPTLSDLVASTGMAIPKFLEIAIPLADALAAAHQKQITHRDLKPGNVMISHDGRVKVLDFGLARVGGSDVNEHSLAATAAPITHQGMIVGTMPYMSPEQVEGRPLDARSDLFSLGVIFYELLSGKRPFTGGSSPALMSAILRDTPPPVTATRADLPEGLERVINRLIEKRPEDRVQTARDVFNELKHLRKQVESSGARPSSLGGGAAVPPQNLWIAVLPFSVRGTDREAAELAAGLTDDIAASLAKFPVFNVVAPQSTRAYQDSALDVRQIADRLGARYVIGGNVRTSARVVRTTAQLVDAASGAQLWSESYDRDASAMDQFAIQDDVTDRIVATIGDQTGVLARSMLRSVRSQLPSNEQTSRELLLRTWGLLQNPVPAEHAELRTAIEARLVLEPDNAELWAELAHVYLDEHIIAINVLPDPLGRATRAARRAVEIDPNNQSGWNELAAACFFARDAAGLFDGAERAVAINPRNAHSLGWMGNLYTHAGEYERGSKLTERAMSINPRHAGWMHFAVFNKHFAAGNYAEALQSARRVNMPQLNWNYFAIASASAHLGALDEAWHAAENMIRITPELAEPHTLREFTERWYWKPEMVDALVDGVLRAFDEGSTEVLRSSNDRRTTAERLSNDRLKPPSSSSGSTRSGALSVAVLPFIPRSSDDESKALADGLTDDITSGLSRFGYLRVLPRSISERLGRKHTEIPSQAHYAIEGHVRRSGTVVRVGVTLVDTQAGSNLWTHSTDCAIADGTFAIQDTVSSAVVATIGDQTGVLMRAMAAAVADRPLDQLSVGALVVKYHLYAESFDPREHARLREAFEHALEREPRAAEGWACLALLYEHEHSFGFNPRPDSMGRERRAAERANELDPNSQQAWIAMASVHCFARDREAVKSAAERAASINPLNAELLALGSIFLSVAGEDDRACAMVQQAMRLKPQHAGWYYFPLFNSAYVRGDYEEALRANKKAGMQRMPLQHLNAIAVSGWLGLEAEARSALRILRDMDPVLGEPEGARAVWARWMWSDDVINSRMDGFRKGLALASGPPTPSATARDDRPSSSASGSSQSGGLSIAVLPFVARSSDDESKALADGLTDDITSGLSRFGYLHVLSRSISERLAREHTQVNTHARYALEGNVRKSGTQVRVGLTLVDTQAGTNLWTQNYDRDAGSGVFSLQDDVASAAVAVIGDQTGVLVRAMAASIANKPVEELSVAELVIRYHLYAEAFRPEEHLLLRDAFERALEKEPRAAEGWACLALLNEHEHGFGLNRKPNAPERQRRAAERAVELDARSQQAWIALASVHRFARDREATRGAIERAVSINPLNADEVALGALFLSMGGDYDRAHALVSSAMAWKPQHAGWYHFPMCHYFIAHGDYESALREVKAVNMPMMPLSHLAAAAMAGHLGRANEARAALASLHQISPALAEPEHAGAFWRMWYWDERFIDDLEQGFRKALSLTSVAGSTERSIAVLPFADLSEKKDQDWFCDGIAEEIMNALAPLPGLRVAGRTSAFSFRGKADDLEAIGEKLNVSTVLEGSVRRSGDRVRITARLSDTREGRQLWSERFDREIRDIFDVQDEIARAIADRLRVSIDAGGERLVPQATTNLEAYELMLKGRIFLNRRGPAIVNAIPCFEQAIALDPNLADAHAGLGDTYRLFAIYGLMPTKEAIQLARTSLERALAIEPDQVEALASLANMMSTCEWNYPESRVLTERALQRDPSHVRALAESAVTTVSLMSDAPSDELRAMVLERIARARAIDPLNAWAMAIEAMILAMLGRDQEALEAAKKAVAADPNNFTAHWSRVFTLAQQDRAAEAEEAAQPGLAMSSRHPMLLSDLATLHARQGEIEKAESIYEELTERSKTAFISPGARAIAAAAAGRMTEARTFLAQAIADRDAFLAFNKLSAWRPIWDDPECAAMLRSSALKQNAPV